MTTRRPDPVRAGLWLLAGVLAVGFASLGVWQYGRGEQKQAVLDVNARVLAERDPHPLAVAAAEAGREPAWSSGRGRFLARPAVLLDNQLRDGRGGVRGYRAFLPEDGAVAVLVDLGWFPLPERSRPPRLPRPDGAFELRGLLAPPPSPGIAMGEPVQPTDDPDTLLAMRMDMSALARILDVPLAPRVLRLDPELQIARLATGHRELDLLANTLPPERHRGYAVQWLGLAAATVVVALVLGFRRGNRA